MEVNESQSMSPSTLPLLKLLLPFLCLALAFADHLPPPCSDEFITLIQQRNITKHCKKLRTLGAEFAWDYQTNDTANSTRIQILFGAKLQRLPGWLAWGVNPGKKPEMIGTKAVIGIMQPGRSNNSVNTYEITKETRIGCRLLPGPLTGDVQVPKTSMLMAYDDRSNFYTISAIFILPSSVYNITKLNHVWQVGYVAANGVQPGPHPTSLENVDSTETINLTSGNGHSGGRQTRRLRMVHGVLNIVGWGTLLPIGVVIARYFRVYPFKCKRRWFYAHVICQSTGFLIGTAGWGIGLWLGHSSTYYTFTTHRIFAIFIFTFTTIQMLALRLKPSDNDDYRKYWNMYHHLLGYSLLATIFINIFKGISILKGGQGWKWTYVGILGVLGAISLGLEIYTWVKFISEKKQEVSDEKSAEAEKVKDQASQK